MKCLRILALLSWLCMVQDPAWGALKCDFGKLAKKSGAELRLEPSGSTTPLEKLLSREGEELDTVEKLDRHLDQATPAEIETQIQALETRSSEIRNSEAHRADRERLEKSADRYRALEREMNESRDPTEQFLIGVTLKNRRRALRRDNQAYMKKHSELFENQERLAELRTYRRYLELKAAEKAEQIEGFEVISGTELNQWFKKKGMSPPGFDGLPAFLVTGAKNVQAVRFGTRDNPYGSWLEPFIPGAFLRPTVLAQRDALPDINGQPGIPNWVFRMRFPKVTHIESAIGPQRGIEPTSSGNSGNFNGVDFSLLPNTGGGWQHWLGLWSPKTKGYELPNASLSGTLAHQPKPTIEVSRPTLKVEHPEMQKRLAPFAVEMARYRDRGLKGETPRDLDRWNAIRESLITQLAVARENYKVRLGDKTFGLSRKDAASLAGDIENVLSDTGVVP